MEPEHTYVELNAGQVRNHEMADAALIVGKTGDPRAIPILVGMVFRDYHSEKAMELIGLAGECAAGPLIDIFLDSDDKKIRLRAGNALAACRSPRAVPIFRTLIDNPDWEFQMVAVQGLAACRAVAEIPRIREKLNAEMALVRWDAAAALFELGVPDGTANMIDAIRRIKTWQVCRYFAAIDGRDPAKIDLLLKILEKKDKRLDIWKAESLWVLTAIHNPTATDYTIRWLSVESPVLKKRALTTLETIHDPRAVEPLVSCLGDPDPEIVFRSIHLLGKCGDLRAVDPIVRQADNPNPRIRECVAKALGRIGDPRSAPVLIRLLADTHSYVRQASALALATAGSTESVGPLLIALNDTSMLVRKNAATALGQTRDTRAFLPLMERLKDPMPGVRSAAARALGMLGDNRASGYLVPLLHDRIGFVRADAVRSLGMLGDEICIPALEDVVKTDPGRDEWGVPVAVTARDVLSGIKNRGRTESDSREKSGNSGNPHQD
jgi:HEAT repeat protein